VLIETEKYIRKPLYVNAIRVTEENFDSVSTWCEGTVEKESGGPREGKQFIKVNVHGVPKSQRQTKAFVGDWLLHTERGFKVYTDNAFRASFDSVLDSVPDTVVSSLNDITTKETDGPINNGTVGHKPFTPPEGVEATIERAPVVSDSASAPPPSTEDGRRILTEVEQREMDSAEVAELLRSGQAILAQDLV
jgi:hypothetical protein